MRKLKEKEVKIIQYLMLAVLFGVAFLLPAYGIKVQREESAEVQTQGNAGTQDIADMQTQENAGTRGSADMQTQNDAGAQDTGENAGSDSRENAGEENAADAAGKGTIVIDAGHGGFDSGMVGGSGITEKALNLVYAKKLEALLTEAGYRVVQTRDTEEGLYDAEESHKKAQDMQRRCAVIEQEQPLLAVSIHQNSYPQDASVCGPQVFYYEHSAEGERLAKCIQTCLNEQLEITRPRVQKGNASYYILKRSASTTVIVECGFLTNPEEEAKLQEEAYQDKLVRAVCDGVLQYLNDADSQVEK